MTEQIKQIKDRKLQLVVLGGVNAGKSTFLNFITNMQGFFNTSALRETNCIWRFNLDKMAQSPYSFFEQKNNKFLEIHSKSEIVDHIKNVA